MPRRVTLGKAQGSVHIAREHIDQVAQQRRRTEWNGLPLTATHAESYRSKSRFEPIRIWSVTLAGEQG
jgi:hypothetical protein